MPSLLHRSIWCLPILAKFLNLTPIRYCSTWPIIFIRIPVNLSKLLHHWILSKAFMRRNIEDYYLCLWMYSSVLRNFRFELLFDSFTAHDTNEWLILKPSFSIICCPEWLNRTRRKGYVIHINSAPWRICCKRYGVYELVRTYFEIVSLPILNRLQRTM